MAESITRKNIDLDILDYYDGKIKNYVDNKVGTGSLTIDDTLSDTSTNPVQNKVVKQAIDNKADSSHTHVKADITDFPTSLPANGGNADTVGGMHADNFIKSVVAIKRTSLDDCITAGTYAVSTVYTTDMPTTYGNWGICDVRVYGLGIFQTIKYTDTAIVICRSKINSQTEWTEWKEISTTPIKSTTFSSTADGTGNFNLWALGENKVPISIQLDNKTFYAVPFLYNNQSWLGSTINEVTRQPVTDTTVSGTVYYIEV